MDFEPSPEQRRHIQLATSFATEAGATLSTDAADFPSRANASLGRSGLFSVRSALDASLVTGALARVSATLGAAFASGWLFVDTLRRHGGASLGAVIAGAETGARIGALVLPSLGAQTEIIASESTGTLTLAGIGAPAALVPVASDAVVVAKLGDDAQILACVDLSTSGTSKGPPLPSLGLPGVPRGAVELRGVPVARDRLLARGSEAVRAAKALAGARSILWGAVAVGVAGHALDFALAHVRAQGNVAQSTEFLISDLATGYDAAYLATAQAAFQHDRGATAEGAASAKLLATRTATQVCHGALTVCGESGYDDALRRAYVDARHLELYDGAESEQIDDIASRMLGES
jgi:alkylation response protein AidB-like acyl-CoA dehydrogenase